MRVRRLGVIVALGLIASTAAPVAEAASGTGNRQALQVANQ